METLEYAAKVAENVYVLEVRSVRVLWSVCVLLSHLLPFLLRVQSINQSISMNLLWRPTSKALGRQKYSENTTA